MAIRKSVIKQKKNQFISFGFQIASLYNNGDN